MEGVLKIKLRDSFSIYLYLKTDNMAVFHLRGYTQKLDIRNASLCTSGYSTQIPGQYLNLRSIWELKGHILIIDSVENIQSDHYCFYRDFFSRNLFPTVPEPHLPCFINIRLIECFCTFGSVKAWWWGTAESSAFKGDYWECILAQGHGCHGDATDLPRLFLTVGGKKLPCQQLCGILAAGENAEMMCCFSICEFKETSLNAVGNSAQTHRKNGFD